MSESTSQQAVVTWFRFAKHELRVDEAQLLFSIPNGSYGGKNRMAAMVSASRMKSEGLLPGAPDLFLAVARNGYHGMFIEMKTPTGRLTPEQRAVALMLSKAGYFVGLATSSEEAIQAITRYLTEPDAKQEGVA
jgi:hypothetical protein